MLSLARLGQKDLVREKLFVMVVQVSVAHSEKYLASLGNSFKKFNQQREQVIPTKNVVNYLIHKASKGKIIVIYNKGKFF